MGYFKRLRANTMYVQIRRDAFFLRHLESDAQDRIVATKSFTTERLLVGQFQVAAALLRPGLQRVRRFFSVAPIVVMHPLEMSAGGLSEVEERIYRELALGAAGARRVVVHTGETLSDFEINTLVNRV